MNPFYKGKRISIEQASESIRIAQERCKGCLLLDIKDGLLQHFKSMKQVSETLSNIEEALNLYESKVETVFESFLERY